MRAAACRPRRAAPARSGSGRPRRRRGIPPSGTGTRSSLDPPHPMTSARPGRLSPRMTTDDHPVARAGSSRGVPRPPPDPDDQMGFDAGLCEADMETLETLARLQLAAHRRWVRVVLRGANGELRDLIAWAGLDAALPCIEGSGIESRRESEQGEEPLGVQEEADPGDLAVRDLDDL